MGREQEMFLQSMSNKQKDLFMKLAIKVAEAKGVAEIAEKNLLKTYGIEMGITPLYETDSNTNDIIRELANISNEKTKKIIIFEILGLMTSYSDFNDMEKKFVDDLAKAFSISNEQCDEMLKFLKEYSELYGKIANLILSQGE